MYNETITYYSKNPFNKFEMEDADMSHFEENVVCGDDITVYIKVEDGVLKDWSFDGDTSLISSACASVYGESIIGEKLEDILHTDYEYIISLIEERVSEKREKAAVLGLLTTRNAIHKFLEDGKVDTFDDVIN